MNLKAVVFDWAGTTVDYGCFAPTGVFLEIFRQRGIEITEKEAREPMGKHKRDHIKWIVSSHRIASEWKKKYGRECSETDIDRMYKNFIPLQLEALEEHSKTVPELPEALKEIRSLGLKIGSTTGYNKEMMVILANAAAKQGYVPDAIVSVSDVPGGRPAPWMAFKNAEKLDVYPLHTILKIGDTVSDIEEGINAGMWSVGVVLSSNEMGLAQDEIKSLNTTELEKRKTEIRNKFLGNEADFVIDSLAETAELIDRINNKLKNDERPGGHTISQDS